MRSRFLNNTSWVLFGQVVRMAVGLVISVLTARYLGPQNFGIINYVASYVTFFASLVSLGINGVIIYEFVNNKEYDGIILGTSILLRFIVGCISTICLYVMVLLIDGSDNTIMTVALIQGFQLPFLCLDTINYWFQFQLKSKSAVISQTIAYLAMSTYKAFLLITGKSVEWFAFASTLDIVILGICYFFAWRKQRQNRMQWDWCTAKRILRSCLPFILANVMVVIYGQVDKIMIKHMIGSDAEVGLYSAAIAICGYIAFIPTAILDSGRPLVAEAKKESEVKYVLRFKQLASGMMWICFFYALIVTMFSDMILNLLYGQKYLSASRCLQIAVWYTIFSYLGSARSFWLICEKKNKYVFIFSALGAISNVIMNAIMIPIWGKEGAALATLITQVMANFIFPVFFRETRQYTKLVTEAICFKGINIRAIVGRLANKVTRKKKDSL